jgi:hypothetical protein
MKYADNTGRFAAICLRSIKYMFVPLAMLTMLFAGYANAAGSGVQLVSELSYIKSVLSEIGPILSGVLFVVAGIFYAVGQILPPDKRANFHTTAINIIIGAIVVGVLSVASTSLANTSTHLLSNMTANAPA